MPRPGTPGSSHPGSRSGSESGSSGSSGTDTRPSTSGSRIWPAVVIAVAAALLIDALAVRVPGIAGFDLSSDWSDLLLLALAGVLGWWAIREPGLGAVGLVGLVFLNVSEVLVRFHGLPSLLQLVSVLLVLVAIVRITPRGARARLYHPLTFWLVAYLAVLLVSTTIASDPAVADGRTLETAKALAIYGLVAVLTTSRTWLLRGVRVLLGAATFLSALGLFQVATGRYGLDFGGLARVKDAQIYGDVFEPRIAGPLGDPNFFAQALLIAVPLGLVMARHEPARRRRLGAVACVATVVAGMVMTYSRGGALSLAVVLALMVPLLEIDVRKALAAVAVVLVGLTVVTPEGFSRRLATIEQLVPGTGTVVDPDSSFAKRKLVTTVAWRVFLDHPLLGVGAGNYAVAFDDYADRVDSPYRDYEDPNEPQYPHNLYLEVAAETGLVGLSIFLGALLACGLSLWRARSRLGRAGDDYGADLAAAVGVALSGYLVSSLFLHGQFQRYLWLLFAFAAVLLGSSRRRGGGGGAERSPATDDRQGRWDASSAVPSGLRIRGSVAVLVSRFPLVTETFVLRELIEMERQGQPVVLVPLIREDPDVVHPRARDWVGRALFTPFLSPAVVAANLRLLARDPGRYLSLLGRVLRSMAGSWNFLIRTMVLWPKAVLLAERLRREEVGHLHAHFATHPTTVAMIVSELTGTRFSFTAHAHDIFVRHAGLGLKLEKASFVRTISDYNRSYLLSRFPGIPGDKIRVVRVGIEPDAFDEPPSIPQHEPPTILCVAAHRPYKGLPVLVEACRILRDRGVDFRCDLVGDGPDRPAVEERVRDAGLEDRVRILGARPEREVASRMSRASVFVLPSVVAEDGQREGIPVVLMEAMAAGRPVVASRLSGIPELVEDGEEGILTEPGDAAAVAAGLERLLLDRPLADRMGRAARRKVRRSWDLGDRVAELVALLERVAAPVPEEIGRIGPVDWIGDRRVPAVGIRSVQRGRDSTVARVLLAAREGAREAVLKIHSDRPGQSGGPPARARREFELLRRLEAAFEERSFGGDDPGSRPRRVGVPRPLGLDRRTGALVMEPCAGVRLDRRLRRDRLAGGSRRIELEGACGAAGAWLRELHRTPFPEVTSVGVAGDPLGALSERAQEGLRRCRESGEIPMPPREGPDPEGDRLRRLARSCGVASSRPVLSHGDYWPGNVFVDDDRVQAIDLEGHGPAAAVEDLAYFTVHLELFFALPLLRRRGERLSRAFLEGYLAGDPLDRPAYRLARDAVALELLAASREGGSGLGDGTSGRLGRRHRSHLRSLLGSA